MVVPTNVRATLVVVPTNVRATLVVVPTNVRATLVVVPTNVRAKNFSPQQPKKTTTMKLKDILKPKSKSTEVITASKRISPTLKPTQPIHTEIELQELKNAIRYAQDTNTYNRTKLLTIYERIIKDSHLKSQIRTAKLSVLKSDFSILRNGNEDAKSKKLFNTGWFEQFIELSLDAEFWGHSLIEFSQINENGHFFDTKIIPRQYVKPEKGIVVLEPQDEKGIAYRDLATKLALIEVGETHNLGLLEIAAKEVIIKNYARSDWSQASENYGMPLLKIKTNTTDSKELDSLQNMAENFSSRGYIIIGTDDEADIIQTRTTDFFKIYLENMRNCDENISKLINGQTGTSDEKAFVGSANVHERILNDYTISRLRKIQNIINDKLIPFLIKWGYPLENCKFQYLDLLKKEPKPEANNLSELFS